MQLAPVNVLLYQRLLGEHARTSDIGSVIAEHLVAHLCWFLAWRGQRSRDFVASDSCATRARFPAPTGASASPRSGACANAGQRPAAEGASATTR
jgi:hypothetical protein